MSVRFAYATNGHQIREVDMHTGTETDIDSFPTPEELWERTFASSNGLA